MPHQKLGDLASPAGRGVRTTWLHSASPLSAEMIARLGWDCLVADMQHSMTGFDEMVTLLQVTTNLGAVVLVRPPALDVALIGRLLDAGASGIICPMVSSVAEAQTLVAACRYPPLGSRSFGPVRARLLFGDDYVSKANGQVLAIAMIETLGGLEALDAIVRVPGLDGVFAGPSDIAASLGRPPRMDTDDSKVLDALRRIAQSAVEANILAGLACETTDYAKRMQAEGYRLFVTGSDLRLMAAASKQLLAEFAA
ncbi:HpcH/HpaI aldolase/citrate lyase family protein [Acidisoma sp. L85]|jgi:4-hydroxy-2-oxoheptanedioate aldolase|uniref:HpcH/HpaI aldolase family protein n=1 Tax=Acidisoma sp. L85 TaxID=1641850 RepID=UPI00131D342F|nr:aldolase/citrate lyase family protein [Acidisoma sp. L85]